MLKDEPLVNTFEKMQMRNFKLDYFRNLAIFEALYQEARSLGALPLEDPLEGIEVDIRLAAALNVREIAGKDRARTG